MPKVSVIIPVYNAAPFLDRCCESLFSQTLDDIEYIFVDDCSTDGSIDVIYNSVTRFPNRKDSVKIISRKTNEGVGAARRIGNEHATGDFIIHCDADDWADSDMYRAMYEKAIANGADIVICSHNVVDTARSTCVACIIPENNVAPNFDISPSQGAVWNKLISRQLINAHHISFDSDLTLGEDFLYVTKCRLCAKKTTLIPKALYNYSVDNSLSITRRYSDKKCASVVMVASRLEAFINDNKLLGEYSKQLNYLKYQAKGFYIMFPETRDLDRYRSLFPECESMALSFPVHPYRKICSLLLEYRLSILALMLLKIKDFIQR